MKLQFSLKDFAKIDDTRPINFSCFAPLILTKRRALHWAKPVQDKNETVHFILLRIYMYKFFSNSRRWCEISTSWVLLGGESWFNSEQKFYSIFSDADMFLFHWNWSMWRHRCRCSLLRC